MTSVVIGCGQGFYGDTPRGALQVARDGDCHYICFDSLAELTMAILQKDRQRNPEGGYARDLPAFMRRLLPITVPKATRLITNAGGMNPRGAAAAVAAVARELGMADLRIAAVSGDELSARLYSLPLEPVQPEVPLAGVRTRLAFAAAYVGYGPIVSALEGGADVVITGRVADASLFVAPMVHELGWRHDDWDRLAAGVVAGHLLECGAQATGGNFSGDWHAVPDMAHIGYPIAEVFDDGSAVIGKPRGSGGRVSVDTLKQQLLYEVGDPTRYINPDVIADFSAVTLTQVDGEHVRVAGARGRQRPGKLKVIGGYDEGWAGVATLAYSWPQALEKAEAAAKILEQSLADEGLAPAETHIEYFGANALHGSAAAPTDDTLNEVMLRYAARFEREADAAMVARLATPLALNGPPFIGGGGPPSPPRQLLGVFTALVDRQSVESHLRVDVAPASEWQ